MPAERPVVLDVPFVSQTEALCGGAAVSMVMRYWGRRDVLPEDFASLVDARQGGIPAARLAADVQARGFDVPVASADAESVRHHLSRGRPPIVLLELAPGRRHYVVLVAAGRDHVVFHDPADRPFRVWRWKTFDRAWAPTGRLMLLVVPRRAGGDGSSATGPERPSDRAGIPNPPDATTFESARTAGPEACGGLVRDAVARADAGDLDAAEARLLAAASLCPQTGPPLRELAGVRFKRQRYAEAAALAAEAASIDTGDALAWRLLATSRYLQDDQEAALGAWNRVGEPQVDLVRIEGLGRTRPAVVSSRLGIAPRTLLRPDALRRAARRLAAMPTLVGVRLRYQPVGAGRAEVTAAVVERPLLPSLRSLVLRAGVDAVARSETRLGVASPGGEGGWLQAGVRWRERRPAAWLSFDAPGALGLPGLVSIEALYDEQRYLLDDPSAPVVERRRRAAVSSRDWLSAQLQARLSVAVERADRAGTTGLVGVRLERRLAADRLAAIGAFSGGIPLGSGSRFALAEARLAARSSANAGRGGVAAYGRFGFSSASPGTPLAYWPGAGTGAGRDLLLRAHPLLVDGLVTGEAFGRRLLDGGAEVDVPLLRVSPGTVRLAGFLDLARPWDRATARFGADRWLADAGIGLRLRSPAVGVVRLDLATPVDRHRLTVSAGWQPPWPR